MDLQKIDIQLLSKEYYRREIAILKRSSVYLILF